MADFTPQSYLLKSYANSGLPWWKALAEFVDNSINAGCSRVVIEIDKRILTISDDGLGAKDIMSLFILGDNKHPKRGNAMYGIGAKDAWLSCANEMQVITVHKGLGYLLQPPSAPVAPESEGNRVYLNEANEFVASIKSENNRKAMLCCVIISQVLYEVDESNFHVAGGTWEHINDLWDSPGTCVGTLADWVCLIASEWHDLGDDRYEDLAHRTNDLARGFLQMTNEEWESLECIALEHVRVRLNDFLKRHAEAA